jgi:acyl-CoA thioester hydrolase
LERDLGQSGSDLCRFDRRRRRTTAQLRLRLAGSASLCRFVVFNCIDTAYGWSVPGERFRYSQRVTYSHCTIGDHVYYSRYLEMLETARGEFLRALGDTFAAWQAKGVIFPVIECRLSYKSPARYDDVLSIELFVTVAERARLNFGYRITSENGTLILEGETWHVCTDLNNKPRRLPEDLMARLEPFLGAS